jgi:hypothetical protein
MLVLNEVWTQDKVHILVRTLLGWHVSTGTGFELQAAHFVAD